MKAEDSTTIDLAGKTTIADYMVAGNAFDTAAMLATFKDDAIVNDIQREFWGKEAIKAWIDKELVGARVKMKVVRFVEGYGDVILTANYRPQVRQWKRS